MAYTAIYSATDLANISIDIAGMFLNAFGLQASALATLIVVTVLIVLVTDLLTGIFGIVSSFRMK